MSAISRRGLIALDSNSLSVAAFGLRQAAAICDGIDPLVEGAEDALRHAIAVIDAARTRLEAPKVLALDNEVRADNPEMVGFW